MVGESAGKVPGSFADRAGMPLFLLSGAFSAAAAVSYLLMNVCLLDEGVTTMHAYRISTGQVIYRDFFCLTTPLSYLSLGLLYKAFGATILTGRIFSLAVFMATLIMTAAILKRTVRNPLFAAVVLAMTCQTGFTAWPYPSHHTMANMFAIAALLFYVEERVRFRFFLVGGFSALTFWSLQDEGFYLISAALVMFFFAGGKMKREFLEYTAGGFAFSAPLVLYLSVNVPFGRLFECLVEYPFSVYHTNPGNKFDITHPLRGLVEPWKAGQFGAAPFHTTVATLTSAIVVAAPLAALVILVALWIKKREDRNTLAGFLALFVSFVGTAMHRFAPINLMFASVASALVIAYYLDSRHGKGPSKALRAAVVAITACYLFIGAKAVSVALKAQGTTAVRGPAGTIRTFREQQALRLQELLDKIEENVPENGRLMTREMPLVNFLVRRPNPVGIDFFQPPYETPEAWTEKAIGDLEKLDDLWVATFSLSSARSIFDGYLDANFEPFFDNGQFTLWKRKAKRTPP